MYNINVFGRHFWFIRPGVFSLLLSYGASRKPREHRGASVGPGQGSWHMLWGFKVSKTCKKTRDRFPTS